MRLPGRWMSTLFTRSSSRKQGEEKRREERRREERRGEVRRLRWGVEMRRFLKVFDVYSTCSGHMRPNPHYNL